VRSKRVTDISVAPSGGYILYYYIVLLANPILQIEYRTTKLIKSKDHNTWNFEPPLQCSNPGGVTTRCTSADFNRGFPHGGGRVNHVLTTEDRISLMGLFLTCSAQYRRVFGLFRAVSGLRVCLATAEVCRVPAYSNRRSRSSVRVYLRRSSVAYALVP
jgi:hypothetical protein